MTDSPSLETWIDPALEARVVAYILGEASEFEKAELERLIAEQPELDAFAKRIRAVHGLLGEAVAPPSDTAWKLPAARRARLGPILRNPKIVPKKAAPPRKRHSLLPWLAAAALLCSGIFVLGLLSLNSTGGIESQKAESPGILASWGVQNEMAAMESEDSLSPDKYDLDRDGIAAPADGEWESSSPGGGSQFALSAVDARRGRSSSHKKLPPSPASRPTAQPSAADMFAINDRLSGSKKDETAFNANSGNSYAWRDALEKNKPMPGIGRGEGKASGIFPVTPATPTDFEITEEDKKSVSLLLGDIPLVGRLFKNKDVDGDPFAGEGEGAENESKSGYIVMDEGRKADISEFEGFVNYGDSIDQSDNKGDKKNTSLTSTLTVHDTAQAMDLVNEIVKESRKSSRFWPPEDNQQRKQLESGNAAEDPTSTFSLNVSNASFKIAAAALLERSQWPDAHSLRTEDFVNNFDYGDPAPSSGEAVICANDQAASPFLPGRNLVRISLRTGATGRASTQPLKLTVLLDNSGSMERPDRRSTVHAALTQLAGLLQAGDTVTLLSFARTPRLLADRIGGAKAQQLPKLAADAPPEGGTNLEEALDAATDAATRQFDATAQNRIILLTDGAANLGNTIPESLARKIINLRQHQIAFDACGVGTEGLDDAILEALTRKGDGRYKVLDTPEDADSDFAQALAGAFRPAARNVKVQVRFNPERVGLFQLLGFEKHRLKEEDFRNDRVDAAEMAAAEQGSAVYQIQLLPDGRGDIGDIGVRFLDTASNRMVERHWTIPYDADTPSLENAAPGIQLAATAALFAEHLKGTPIGHLVDLNQLTAPLNKLHLRFQEDKRVAQLAAMVERARLLRK